MNRMTSLSLAMLSFLCLASVGMCAEEVNFEGTWVIYIGPKSQRETECPRAVLTLLQERDRLCGNFTFATPTCSRVDEGDPPSVKGIVVDSTAVLVVTSGRNGAIVLGKATRKGDTLHWTTLEEIKAGEPERDSPLILDKGTLKLDTPRAASLELLDACKIR
jgi:hypothetical protein